MNTDASIAPEQRVTKPPSTFGWIFTSIVALALVKTLGVAGGIAALGAYYWLQPRIGTFFAIVGSAALGIVIGIGLAVLFS